MTTPPVLEGPGWRVADPTVAAALRIRDGMADLLAAPAGEADDEQARLQDLAVRAGALTEALTLVRGVLGAAIEALTEPEHPLDEADALAEGLAHAPSLAAARDAVARLKPILLRLDP